MTPFVAANCALLTHQLFHRRSVRTDFDAPTNRLEVECVDYAQNAMEWALKLEANSVVGGSTN